MSPRNLGLLLLLLAAAALAVVWLRAGGREVAAVVEERAPETMERGAERANLQTVERESSSSAPRVDAEPPGRALGEVEEAELAAAGRANGLASCVVYGKVLDAGGHAVGARQPSVSLTSSTGAVRHTRTGDDGDYALAGLAPGSWTLAWQAMGFRKQSATLELGADAPIVRRDLTLEKGVLLSVWLVTPSGEPFGAALGEFARLRGASSVDVVPIATLEAPGEEIGVQDVRESPVGVGTYNQSGPLVVEAGTGVLELEVELPVFVSLVAGPRVLATQRVEQGATEVTFVLDPEALLAQQATVRARFVAAETGEPLSGMIQSVDEASTVRDGLWESVLTPGKHEFHFWSAGNALVPVALTLAVGQEFDLGEIRVPRELTVEGRLLDDENRPVPGLLEIGTPDEHGVVSYDTARAYKADESGHYEITGLLAARYVVRTQVRGEIELASDGTAPLLWVTGPVPVSTLGGSVTNFDLHLVKAAILELKNGHALPPESCCKLLDERGALQRYVFFWPGSTPRFALPPGGYTLVLCAKDWSELSRRAVTLGAGMTTVDVGR